METTTVKTGYAPVNGLEMYYEIRGSGSPIIMIHGGFGAVEMFGPLIESLTANHQVITVELQGHGHTADIDRPLSLEAFGSDVAELIKYLNLGKADILGYSMGGGAALQATIQHPELVGKLILISSAFRRSGWYPESQAGMAGMNAEVAEFMKQSPMYASYMQSAPRPEDWTRLVVKMGDMLRTDYDWTDGVAAMKTPTLIILADGDGVQLTHAVEMFQLLGGAKADAGYSGLPQSQFAVVPGALHWTIQYRTDILLPMISTFLDPPQTGTDSPAEQ